MRKYMPFVLAALVILAGSTFIAGAATPPDKVTIDDCVAKKAAVAFPHGEHAKAFECKTCHHTQPALTATSTEKVEACGTCHVTPEKAETPKCSEMSATKNPFHMSCVNCHKEELAKKPDTKAPTKCDQCHPKA
jgi:hypothetical protein